jgi:AraC-like DNA-binding protein
MMRVAEFLGGPPLSFVAGLLHACPKFCPVHSHPAIEIVYHLRGRGSTTVNGREIPFETGSVIIYPPYVEHDQRIETDGEDACVLLGVERGLPRVLETCIAVPALGDASLADEILALSRARPDGSPILRATLAHRATAVLGRLLELAPAAGGEKPKSRPETYLERAQRYIGDNYQRIQSVHDVAKHVGLGADHLRHLFRRLSGTTVIGYVTTVRLARAKALLRFSDLPLKTIAAHCGFRNERYFSEVFRKQEGRPPGEFRQGR